MSLKQLLKKRLPYVFEIWCYLSLKMQAWRGRREISASPENFVSGVYERKLGKKPDLADPKTFNEKLNWLKIHWFDERAYLCASKFRVREYIESKGLGFLLNDLYGVWENPSDIDFDALPDRFVLKASHDSGHLILVNDKKALNRKLALFKMKWWLKNDYCFTSGEWPYYTEKPVIICERLLEDRKRNDVCDYKFFCFNGEPVYCYLCRDRLTHVKTDFYDLDWNHMPFRWHHPNAEDLAPRPECFDEMISYARTLSEGFPFVRVDFYEVEGKVVFGEMTFFHGGGRGEFHPESADLELGQLIRLPSAQDPWKDVFSKMENKK